jgi:hypothetical protein
MHCLTDAAAWQNMVCKFHSDCPPATWRVLLEFWKKFANLMTLALCVMNKVGGRAEETLCRNARISSGHHPRSGWWKWSLTETSKNQCKDLTKTGANSKSNACSFRVASSLRTDTANCLL